MNSLYVINAKGEKEIFSRSKIYRSTKIAGVSSKQAQEIAINIEEQAFPGIKTLEIFKKVQKLLREKNSKFALKFSLKNAMKKLGPTGFPFEKYIGCVLKENGFEIKINQYLPGRCVSRYEIDFLAQKENLVYIGECKYRTLSGERIGSKEALANYARFLDILNGPYFKTKRYRNFRIKTMMATNTKFTKRTMEYSKCMNVNLLGWKCPKNNGLEYLIENQKLYPITILPSLKKNLKNVLVSEKIMLVQNLLKIDIQKFARKFRIPTKDFQPLIKEAKILMKN